MYDAVSDMDLFFLPPPVCCLFCLFVCLFVFVRVCVCACVHVGASCPQIASQSQFNPVYRFEYTLPPQNERVEMRVTSVAGHLMEVDFSPGYDSWNSVNPAVLFDAPIIRYVARVSAHEDMLNNGYVCCVRTFEFVFVCLCLNCEIVCVRTPVPCFADDNVGKVLKASVILARVCGCGETPSGQASHREKPHRARQSS